MVGVASAAAVGIIGYAAYAVRGPPGAAKRPQPFLALPYEIPFCAGRLHERAGRSTARSGGSRPGQMNCAGGAESQFTGYKSDTTTPLFAGTRS